MQLAYQPYFIFTFYFCTGVESDFFEGDIKLSGQNPYENIVKRDAGGSGSEILTTKTDKETSNQEGYKSRDDLWEGGKVLYKFDSILSKLYNGALTILLSTVFC